MLFFAQYTQITDISPNLAIPQLRNHMNEKQIPWIIFDIKSLSPNQ